jgi:hypothetical protein
VNSEISMKEKRKRKQSRWESEGVTADISLAIQHEGWCGTLDRTGRLMAGAARFLSHYFGESN